MTIYKDDLSNQRYQFGKILGIIGGGQLGKMTINAATQLGISCAVLDPAEDCPCSSLTNAFIKGSLYESSSIKELIEKSDVITCEIEHFNPNVVIDLIREIKSERTSDYSKVAYPNMDNVKIIQDKYTQKLFLKSNLLPLPFFGPLNQVYSLLNEEKLHYPFLVKARCNAYDGHGTTIISNKEDLDKLYSNYETEKLIDKYYVEELVEFFKELAVLVVCSICDSDCNSLMSYPVVETIQKDHRCHIALVPAQIPFNLAEYAKSIAFNVVKLLMPTAGIFCVEMFCLSNGTILINEIAPRPHNSGHFSIDACLTSQFENHVRAVMGLPLGSTKMKTPVAMMVNIIGSKDESDNQKFVNELFKFSITNSELKIHWYGKKKIKAGRKMGHMTLLGDTVPSVVNNMESILQQHLLPGVGTKIKEGISLNFDGYQFFGSSEIDSSTSLLVIKPLPVVGIVMGSDSDLPTMRAAALILKQFNVPFQMTLVSAHRTPERLANFGSSAIKSGIKVIIAGAGGAAHLPGMLASYTSLPVIGVPIIPSTASTSGVGAITGIDALYSIVQMPMGIPVATVAVGNATNAALLALRILSVEMISIGQALKSYHTTMMNSVLTKSKGLANYTLD